MLTRSIRKSYSANVEQGNAAAALFSMSKLTNFREALTYLKSCVCISELHCGYSFMYCTLVFQFISLSLMPSCVLPFAH